MYVCSGMTWQLTMSLRHSTVVVAFCLASSVAHAQEVTYTVLEVPSLGGKTTAVTGLNDLGTVIGTSTDANERPHGFVYSSGANNLTEIPSICPTSSCDGNGVMFPNAINASGVVVGRGLVNSGDYHAFVYDPSLGTSHDLGTLGGRNSSALSINDSGNIVGWAETPSGQRRGFRYDLAFNTVIELPEFDGLDSMAIAIDNSGRIVGLADTTSGTFTSVIWTCAQVCTAARLDTFGGNSAAYSINGTGIVVGEADSGTETHAYLIAGVGSDAMDLGSLGGPTSTAEWAAPNGDVVGAADVAPDLSHAFVYRDGQMHDLNSVVESRTGVVLFSAEAINRTGQIAANGLGDGTARAFILTPPDSKAPSIQCESADTSWHSDNVSFDCTAQDPDSGLANPNTDASFTLATAVSLGDESANAITNSRQVCDVDGNCAIAGPITGNKIDRKGPVVNCATADGVWHGTNVNLACSSSDSGSGLAVSGDASFNLSTTLAAGTESANVSTGSRSVCDGVNNCTPAGPIGGNKIDRKVPTISITSPTASTYTIGQNIASDFACADAGSGLASCVGTVADGASVNTGSVGHKTFAVNATDNVSNASSASVGFDVTYGVYLLYDPTIKFQTRSQPLMKVQLRNASGQNQSAAGVVVTAVRIARRADNTTVKTVAGNFVFDATLTYAGAAAGGGYKYTLDLKSMASGQYNLVFRAAGDPVDHVAPFDVR